jgi:dipeptidyl-peptidase-4
VTTESFPRQYARTRRFTLGAPRDFRVSRDGARVAFLRSQAGDDPLTCLWMLDLARGEEQLVVDPRTLLEPAGEQLAPQERARRERAREQSTGIVRYTTDDSFRAAVFDLSGRVYLVDLVATGDGGVPRCRELVTETPALDPRIDPTGRHVAYVAGGALRVVGVDAGTDRALVEPEGAEITYGLAEFIAAEEMGRLEGYWWSPDGTRILAARVDTTDVQRWHIADPAHPERPATVVLYPSAGTPNAVVTLSVVGLDGSLVPVVWDRERFEYLVTAAWSELGLLVVVQSRDQKAMQVLDVDAVSGETTVLREDSDKCWVDIVDGVPRRLAGGALVWTEDIADTRRLLVDGTSVTAEGLQVVEVLGADGDSVLFAASSEPTEVHVWRWSRAGGVTPVLASSTGAAPGGAEADGIAPLPPETASARSGGGTTVLVTQGLDHDGQDVRVLQGGAVVARIASLAETPVITPNPQLLRTGKHDLRLALFLPSGHEPGAARLPVIMDPYGGPHHRRVMAARNAHVLSQWFADQGFAVVVADGRGTGGRGPSFDRTVFGDLAGPPLEDQVEALEAAAEHCGDLDLTRVGIRGWSFGGFLAALAVIRRPDVFHAAVAGAPVSDQRLYTTHYTERYLGDPLKESENYERSSLLADAARLERPLLLIHGMVDDNVVVAHTLRLSSALLAAGKVHSVLPLSGVTHMTPQEVVAENLLLLQLDFLRAALSA